MIEVNMDELLERFFKHLQTITIQFYEIKVDETEPDLSPRLLQVYEALAVAVESLHTAESELRQQYEQVVESEQMAATERERYYDLFDGAPDAYVVTNEYGTIQEVNHAAVDLLNVSAAYLQGKPMALYVVPEERHAFRAFTLALAEQRTSRSLKQEFTIQSRGVLQPIPVSATAIPIQDHNAHVTGFRWLLRDISQRRQAQVQLQNSNHLLKSLIDASPLAIVAIDEAGRVQQWNKAAEHLLGWAHADIVGQSAPPTVLDCMGRALESMSHGSAQTAHHQSEMEQHRRDGTLIPVRIAVATLEDANHQRTGMIALIADLREEVEHRADMRTIKARLSATRDIERRRMAQDMHDGVIQQLVGINFLLVHYRNLTDDPTPSHLAEVQAGLRQIGSDIGTIVRFLRGVINDLRPPGLEAMGLKKTLEGYILKMQQTWQPPAPQIQLVLPDEEIDLLMPVAMVLMRVVQEALRNVYHHAGAQQVTVRVVQSATGITVEVEDTGKGFESPPRLTDLAYEGHFGLLGLAEQVESVGGLFQIVSTPNQGTILSVAIPFMERVPDPYTR
jgi:PAS domain S-box-containing protein